MRWMNRSRLSKREKKVVGTRVSLPWQGRTRSFRCSRRRTGRESAVREGDHSPTEGDESPAFSSRSRLRGKEEKTAEQSQMKANGSKTLAQDEPWEPNVRKSPPIGVSRPIRPSSCTGQASPRRQRQVLPTHLVRISRQKPRPLNALPRIGRVSFPPPPGYGQLRRESAAGGGGGGRDDPTQNRRHGSPRGALMLRRDRAAVRRLPSYETNGTWSDH